ncbi:MAG: DsbA family protein [Candidatus Saccharimonadales bacterium]
MSKQFLGVIVIITLIFIGIFTFTGKKSDTGNKASSSSTLTQHTQGLGSTGVTLTEYGDYECPYCSQYYPIVKQVQAEYNQQIKLQFRNFPLVNLHRNAFAAARAAEAAGLQNKYWEMHDLLYESQQQWSSANDATSIFQQFASQLKLNINKYNTDFGSGKVNDLINADTAEGTKLGVTGTPTFYLDGKMVTINQSLASFEKVINAEIAKKSPASTNPNSATPKAQ